MRHSSRRLICLAFLFFVLSAIPARAGDAPWVEVRSEHFTVITDAGEKNGRRVADRFEQMRTIFGLLFGRTKINQPVPLEIIAFRNTKEIRQYSSMFKGKVVEVAGFFQQGEDKDFIAVDMSQEDNWRTVFHEYAHVLLNSNYQRTAPWFDEGFAEFFSSTKVSPGEIEVGPSVPDADFLMQGNRLHLLELFQVQHHSETYNVTGERREMFYVQSWLVVHYLLDTGRMRETAKYFLLTNEQKMPVAEAVQSAYGVSPAELEKTILNYLRAGKLTVLRYTGKDQIALTYNATARPLDQLEVRAQLADLHLHSQDYGALAMKEFEEVLREDPKQVEAQRGLGYAYLRNQELDKAGEHFRAAAKLGSKDARVYYYSAVLLQRTGSRMTSPEFAENLQRAIELDPQYADAYALLGTSLMNSGDVAGGEENMRRAIELSPRNEFYFLNYAAALLNQQKVDEAQTLLASVANSSNPQAAERAKDMLQRIEQYKTMATLRDKTDGFTVRPREATGRTAASQGAMEDAKVAEPTPEPTPKPNPGPVRTPSAVKYLTGTLVGVDCSSPPLAMLSVTSGGQTWRMKVPDSDHVIVIGADKFSCSWGKKKVALNYRPTGTAEGNVVSLEIQ